jgi:hypothetical protein
MATLQVLHRNIALAARGAYSQLMAGKLVRITTLKDS